MGTYRVLAERYRGFKEGDVFDLALTKNQEDRAISGGYIEAASKEEAEEAAAPPELEDLSRAELNKRAERLGIESPDKLGNKSDVIEAIREQEGAEA